MAVDLDRLLPVLLEDLRRELGMAMLRPVTYPLAPEADVDALLAPERQETLLRTMVAWASAHGLSLTWDRTHAPKICLALHDPWRDRDVVLEVWTHIEVRDPAGASARVIPWDRVGHRLNEAGIRALLYLGHLATKGKDRQRPAVRARLEGWSQDPVAGAQVRALLEGSLTIDDAATWANARLRDLGILAGPSVADRLAHRQRARQRHARRARVATGIIAVTGPDGSGKGTVIDHLRQQGRRRSVVVRFKNLFRHHPVYRLLVACHGRGPGEEKNQWDERHGRALFRLARQAWPWLRVRAALGTVQWCDRYWHDLLFDGFRIRSEVPCLTPSWREFVAQVPVPGWHLHLDAPDAVILARKDELPAAALPVYRAGMLDLILARAEPLVTFLQTGGTLDETLAAARRAARWASWP